MTADLRPGPDEYAPFYAAYVARVDGADPLDLLGAQRAEIGALLGGVTEAQAAFRYAPGKWSVREVVGHLCDAERVFTYRALRFGRGDSTPLPGFEENDYVAASGADARPLASLAHELDALRGATEALFAGLPPEAFARTGTANGHAVSVRALLHITLGHAAHHVAVLRERYLSHPDLPR